MTDQNQAEPEQEQPPEFIRRDPNHRELLYVSHREVEGAFTLRKPTFGVRGELGRVRGTFLGPFPDPASEVDAEIFATISVGFERTPEGFDPSKIVSFSLMEALFKEVSAYWAGFQD